jgi:hypothetical protein
VVQFKASLEVGFLWLGQSILVVIYGRFESFLSVIDL